MSGVRVSPRSPAVLHVVKFKRRAHERSRSCLEVAWVNGYTALLEERSRSMSQIQKTWFADIRRNFVLMLTAMWHSVTVPAAVSAARTTAILPGLSREATRQ
jgi:hypothetical protein